MTNKINKGKRILPPLLNYLLTSGFGMRGGQMHMGADYVGGSDVLAVFGGVVVEAVQGCIEGQTQCGGGYGNYITIDHENGYFTRYAHLQNINVQKGQRLKIGAKIGKLGNTGQSFGAHLHFEVLTANTFYSQNPKAFLDPVPFVEGKMLFPAPTKPKSKFAQALLFLLAAGFLGFMAWFMWAYKGFPSKKILPPKPPADTPQDIPVF
jgi:murein DD-endopeptidase MepM/ murein hydrolase activator NlpD